MTDTSTSPSVDRTTTPEASVALGVSSNSPSINGHAQEQDTTVNENDVDIEKVCLLDIILLSCFISSPKTRNHLYALMMTHIIIIIINQLLMVQEQKESR